MKKLMILGGSENQLPLIKCAKQKGYNIVLCDYSEDTIGKEYADIFYCVSTLDKNAILQVAEKEKIDGIVTNSEPAMLIATFVGNKLGLPSNPYESVVTLSRKDLFRNFLRKNEFNCPKSYDTDEYNSAVVMVSNFKFPLMVKPVDSSGSRGVNRINSIDELEDAFKNAIVYSKVKRVMIEEYIERTHDYMIGGDIFVLDGEIVFWGLMNSMREKRVSEFVPVGTSFPTFISEEQFDIIQKNIKKLIDLLNIKFGPFNLELMFDEENELFIIEMNPRNGGNRIPEILNNATGVNLIKANIEASLGLSNVKLSTDSKERYMSTYVLHSDSNGILKRISYNEEIKKNVSEVIMTKQIQDRVEKFDSADKLIGIAFLEFSTLEEMKFKLGHIKELIKIDIQQ